MRKLLSKALFVGFISSGVALGFEIDPELNQICDAFEKIGVNCGTAYSDSKSFDYKLEKDKNGMIRLKGVYKDYDQFLSAYMIAQAIAGVSRVSPAFNSFDTNIKIRKSEVCLSSLMTGENKVGNYECDVLRTAKTNAGAQKFLTDKYALIISVGKYKYINAPLGDAPLNDALLVEQNLKQRGYKVITLKNEQATKQNVLKTLDEIIYSIPSGGTFFLYASTHGSPKNEGGETGIVLYDTSVESSNNCKTIDIALQSSGQSRDIVLTSAKKMCNVLSNSLVITEDVIPRINASGKNIKFISSLDVCYSGGVFKNIIEKAREGDVYSIDENVARYLTFTYPHEMIYISSASNQPSLQKEFKDKKIYGIFTYHFFNNLPKNNFDLKQNYHQILPEVEKESGTTCRALRTQNPRETCDTNGQKPLLINNLRVKDYRL